GAGGCVVAEASDDGCIAIGREGDRPSLGRLPQSARADQFRLLTPRSTAPGPNPRRAGAIVIVRPSDDCGVAVRGNGYGRPLLGVPDGPEADEFGLLRPESAASGPHPGRPIVIVVAQSSDD